MYKLYFYVPVDYADRVKNALFDAGAGKIGNYAHCAWQVLGEGQFIPLEKSNAFIGEKGQLEKVLEYRVDMICDKHCINEVIAALKQSHPYEQPAYQVIQIEDF